MQLSKSTKTFLLGLSVSVLVLFVFFAGALADRIFVIKPLDYLTGQSRLGQSSVGSSRSADSPLGRLALPGGTATSPNQFGGSSVADVAELASDSVVTVSVKRQERVLDPSTQGIFGFMFGGPLATGEVREVQRDIGTGFVANGQGLIVTNRHVVADPSAEYLVIDKDDREYQVTDIYLDPTIDMAILQVEGLELAGLPLGNSDQVRVGESVIVIGTALGEFRHTVTTGVVSGLGRGIQAVGGGGRSIESLEGIIQTDAAINPGNSGGPLLNAAGEVIGVSVATSVGAENIGFAIPINVVKSSIENFNQTGQFERAFLGVSYRMISEQAALFNEVPQGAYVLEVVGDSAAAQAGVQPGDIITQLDGQRLTEETSLASVINQKKVGDRIEIVFWRGGREVTEMVVLNSGR